MSALSTVSDAGGVQFGTPMDAETLERELAEPLRESAPVAFQAAMSCCPPAGAARSCQGYHAVWQYLRLAGSARSLRVDGALYVAAAERLARMGVLRRILITATADYSMLAHLAFGARRGGADPAIHVVDRCASTLRMNKWYGERQGLTVETTQSDVLRFRGSQPYDLICSHSFLHWLSPDDRPDLFRLWRNCLSENGRLCFSSRVWADRVRFGADEMAQRVERIVRTAIRQLEALGVPLPCAMEEFANLVRQYGFRRDEHLPLPMADVESWIDDAGLGIEIAVPATEAVAKTRDEAPGPFPISRGPRMWFQARAV